MKKIFLIFVLLTMVGCAQITPPSGYTNPYKFRLWAGNTGVINPSKDSLDANWSNINDTLYAKDLQLQDVRSKFYAYHTLTGLPSNNSISWAMLGSDKNTYIMQLSGAQTVTGTKTFASGGLNFTGSGYLQLPINVPAQLQRLLYGDLNYVYYSKDGEDGSQDTLASHSWVRTNVPTIANSVTLNTEQNITGKKYYYWLAGVSSGTLQVPGLNNEVPNSIYGDNNYLYYSKSGFAGGQDTLASNNWVRTRSWQTINPSSTSTYSLGSSTYKWKELHIDKVYADQVVINSISPAGGGSVEIPTNLVFSDSTKSLGTASKSVGCIYVDTIRASGKNMLIQSSSEICVNTPLVNIDSSISFPHTVSSAAMMTIQVKSFFNKVNTEGTYTNINGETKDGTMIIIYANVPITLNNGGNMKLSASFSMDRYDTITLIYDADNSYWIEISRTDIP